MIVLHCIEDSNEHANDKCNMYIFLVCKRNILLNILVIISVMYLCFGMQEEDLVG